MLSVYGRWMRPFAREGGGLLCFFPIAAYVVGSESGKLSRQKSSGVSYGW